jgi:hypothetical protein
MERADILVGGDFSAHDQSLPNRSYWEWLKGAVIFTNLYER